MRPFLVSIPLFVAWFVRPTAPATEHASFVTTLGRDTVVIESFTRTPAKLDGDMVVRVPGTVLCHYELDLGSGGNVTRSVVDVKPISADNVAARHVTLDYTGDSLRVTIDSAGTHAQFVRAVEKNAYPQFMTGFGSSYGLYSSLGVYEVLFAQLGAKFDSVTIPSIDMQSGRTVKRDFVRRSPTTIDADYFRIAWTHLTLDDSGQIASADADQTTEKTKTQRTAYVDPQKAAKQFASEDKSGKGLGIASPSVTEKATLGGKLVVVLYSSPRRRNRTILGTVVPYDQVWRTGANQATVLVTDDAFDIGGASVPGGSYSLWTVPKKDGSADLIVNGQYGQWGTNYDSSRNVVRVPMKVSRASSPQENFSIDITPTNGNSGEMKIAWDTFVWTVPITMK
ncbi:MAG TPA: DUF2911 domain-containing protein [Gemmatimonadaceae bacterium]|nr:DUF2911 domain-containing protein [Gemmatimonadaceae bacterium]